MSELKTLGSHTHLIADMAQSHPHLRHYLDTASDQRSIDAVIGKSLEKLGFFSRHPPRAMEYPWIFDEVSATSGNVVDIGAGLSPIPFLLADRGRQVLTIDYSDLIRDPSNRTNWSEWGYLDYGLVDPRIRSMNMDFGLAPIVPESVGCVYSVSVIEHMPAAVRRRVWDKVGQSLQTGGHLVLTLDLKPQTHILWNRDRGKLVENADLHGTIGSLIDELGAIQIGIEHMEIARKLPGSVTDIVLLRGRKL